MAAFPALTGASPGVPPFKITIEFNDGTTTEVIDHVDGHGTDNGFFWVMLDTLDKVHEWNRANIRKITYEQGTATPE